MKKFNVEEFKQHLSTMYNQICYKMLKEKLFQSFGLEMSAANIQFDTNDTFALKDMTFGYFNPIDNSIHVNIEDKFFTLCKTDSELQAKLIFILFHELYHHILLHTDRKGTRIHTLWNIAVDYEVHNMLYLYNSCVDANFKANQLNSSNQVIVNFKHEFDIIHTMLENANDSSFEADPENGVYQFMFDKSCLNKMAEEIYNDIQNSKKEDESTMSISLNDLNSNSNNSQNNKKNNNSSGSSDVKVKVTKTTYTLPNGKKYTTYNIDWPDMDDLSESDPNKKSKDQLKQEQENARLRRQIMEENLKQECERNKGSISTKCQEFLKKIFKIKIDWEKILKNSLQTVLSKSDYFSWAKPRKITMSMDLPYLPDIVDDNNSYGKVYVCVDQSGSMTDDDFTKIGNIIIQAKDHYKKIIVIQHDTDINHIIEFEDLNEDNIKEIFTRTSCGGTSHMKVYDHIASDWSESRFNDEDKISAVIVCSDCCSDIQTAQKKLNAEIPMIYLVPMSCKEDGYTKDIRGQIIYVE